MITPAHRLDGISEYYFAAKLREIATMRQQGKAIINLGIGSPDLPPAPNVIAALTQQASQPDTHGYQSYTGIAPLRKAWANWYKQYYNVTGLNEDTEVLPLIGSKEGIVHIAMTFLEPGDVAMVPNPGYPTYRAASMLAGAKVMEYTLDAANGWQPDLERLGASDLSKVKIMWVNYPHMPTGAPGNSLLFQRLVNFGKQHNILIVNDNPYSFVLNDNPASILAATGASGIAIELNSLSKSHNMAGWRIGAVLGHTDILKNILRFKSNMDSGQFLPMQHAAIAALEAPQDWYDQQNVTYKERQALAFKLLDYAGATYNSNQQGMFVWAKIPDEYADSYAMSDALLYKHWVFLTPGGIFGTQGDRYIRISLCQETTVFEEALRRLSPSTFKHPSNQPTH